MTAIIDLECDSPDPKKAKLKFFGGLDVDTGNVTILDYNHKEAILSYIKSHNVLIGFNIKKYDFPILERFGCDLEKKPRLDLYEALAPKGDRGYGRSNKDRLHDINPSLELKNYKLKTIVETLKLDKKGKEEIDYNIFKKNKWTKTEIKKIEKYLKKDLEITYKLFKKYRDVFKPLEPYLDKKTLTLLHHLSCTSGSLSYKVLCNLSDIQEEYNENYKRKELKKIAPKIEGGHHIHAKWEKVRGKIYCKDFTSHYPTILIMYNLLDKKQIKAVQKILLERLKAKKQGNKGLALALKVPLNSFYGIVGNPTFKNIYNPKAAKKCTEIGRTLLKRYAQTLDIAGFIPLYGFTDSVYVGIPNQTNKQDLDLVTEYFTEKEQKKAPNQIESFGLGDDGYYKFMWFIDKKDNQYLTVTNENEIKIKGGLFDVNTPKAIHKLFRKYIKPKILKELDVDFDEEELKTELKKILKDNPELSAGSYSVKETKYYNSKTCLNYNISKKYGPGTHKLIPNTSKIGPGKKTSYCSLEDYHKNKLKVKDISLERMMRYLKPFYTTKEEVLEISK